MQSHDKQNQFSSPNLTNLKSHDDIRECMADSLKIERIAVLSSMFSLISEALDYFSSTMQLQQAIKDESEKQQTKNQIKYLQDQLQELKKQQKNS